MLEMPVGGQRSPKSVTFHDHETRAIDQAEVFVASGKKIFPTGEIDGLIDMDDFHPLRRSDPAEDRGPQLAWYVKGLIRLAEISGIT